MAKTAINTVSNCNVYLGGANLLGRAEEVKLPTVKNINVEHKGLGMYAAANLPTGGIEAMEAEYNWTSIYSEVLRGIADPRKGVQVQIRAQVETFSSGGLLREVPLVAFLGGPFMEDGLGGFKQNEAVKPTSKQNVWYYKLEIDNQVVYELDVFSNIRKVAGVDVLARFRNFIGG